MSGSKKRKLSKQTENHDYQDTVSILEDKFISDLITLLKRYRKDRVPAKDWVSNLKITNEFLDPRQESLAAFNEFKYFVDDLSDIYDEYSVRVPIAVNSGTSGSGKTIQLFLVAKHFEENFKGIALYFTFNGPTTSGHTFDNNMDISSRIAHRILYCATNSICSIKRFWEDIREDLGMAAPNEKPGTYPQKQMEHFLQDPVNVVFICRSVLEINTDVPLMIAADELAKLDLKLAPLGETSPKAVEALKILADISQQAFCAKGLKSAGTYIVASAYTAYNPAQGNTVGSNRRVFWLPLPPLSLSRGYDKAIQDQVAAPDAKLVARRLLWLQQGNARALDVTFKRLIKDKSRWTMKSYNEDLLCVKGVAGSLVNYFLEACYKQTPKVDAKDLVRCLFWPRPVKTDGGFLPCMKAALLAEAAALCTIIRRVELDSIFIHPTVCRVLCSKILNVETTASQNTGGFLKSVIRLCENLESLLATTKGSESGKLYERVVTQALVCRLATCFGSTIVLKTLLPNNSGGEVFESEIPATLLPEENITCFPRAAEKLLNNTKLYRNEECPKMPDNPFFTLFTDPYTTVHDSMISVSSNRHKGVGIQMKEWKNNINKENVESFRKHRLMHMEWDQLPTSANVSSFLNTNEYVFVIVSPNKITEDVKPQSSQIVVNGATFVVHEAFLTHDDIREWSPMVAYSGCDVRVLATL